MSPTLLHPLPRLLPRLLLCVFLFVTLCLIAPAHPAHAASLSVGCSVPELKSALNTANTNADADTLDLASNCVYELTTIDNPDPDDANSGTGLPAITTPITLTGNHATIEHTAASDAPAFRLLRVTGAGSLTLNDLILQKGGDNYSTGYVIDGGAILNHGFLTVNNVAFIQNVAKYAGGAIWSDNTLQISHATFSNNGTAFPQDGGGAIYNANTAHIAASTFQNNSAAVAGGALYLAGNTDIATSLFLENSVTGSHGSGAGGAIYAAPSGATPSSVAYTVTNSTFTQNSVGYYANGSAINGAVAVYSSTFADNATSTGATEPQALIGVTVRASIVLNTSCLRVMDGGSNLHWAAANDSCVGTRADPRLDSLQDNGGPTATMALAINSPAVNLVPAALCPSSDQRGVARAAPFCDAGAYELQYTTLDQDNPAAAYDGWSQQTIPNTTTIIYSARDKGATATFSFQGRGIGWHTLKGPDMGIARILLDGVNQGTFDQYFAFPNVPVAYHAGGLSNGPHTLTLQVLGKKNPAASDSRVVIESFTVGKRTTGSASSKIHYGAWHRHPASQALGGKYIASATSGSQARFQFSGTGVQWLTARGPAYGKARAFIDGVQIGGAMDLYASIQQFQVPISFDGLSDSAHTLEIRVLGAKNPASSGATIVIDGYRLPITHSP